MRSKKLLLLEVCNFFRYIEVFRDIKEIIEKSIIRLLLVSIAERREDYYNGIGG